MSASEEQHTAITPCGAGAFMCSVSCVPVLQNRACGWCLPAPGTKVNASVTPLHHVTAEIEGICMAGLLHKILCQWIWNCCECCCEKLERRGELPSSERLSLLAGLVDTQWFSLWFSWMLSHTDKRLCDGGSTI